MKRPKDLAELEQELGHTFRKRRLLEQALTHSSFAREMANQLSAEGTPQKVADNEQLEFLGDAVLGLVTSRELFERFPDFHEGQLSKLRAFLVSAKHLVGADIFLDEPSVTGTENALMAATAARGTTVLRNAAIRA